MSSWVFLLRRRTTDVLERSRQEGRHRCSDYCRNSDARELNAARGDERVEASLHQRVIRLGVKHLCGFWCIERDPETPVVLGRRDRYGKPLESVTKGSG